MVHLFPREGGEQALSMHKLVALSAIAVDRAVFRIEVLDFGILFWSFGALCYIEAWRNS